MKKEEQVSTLIRAALGGEGAAFDRLVERFREPLRSSIEGWSRFQIAERVDPEDVVQDTFLRAFRSLRRFRWQGEDSFFRWLCGIAKRSLAEAIQDQRRFRVTALPADAPRSDPSQGKAIRRAERFDRLEAAMERLPPQYRKVLLLSRVEGLTAKEISERLGRSPNAVKHLLAHALRKLRSEFGDTESLHLPRDRQLGGGEGRQ